MGFFRSFIDWFLGREGQWKRNRFQGVPWEVVFSKLAGGTLTSEEASDAIELLYWETPRDRRERVGEVVVRYLRDPDAADSAVDYIGFKTEGARYFEDLLQTYRSAEAWETRCGVVSAIAWLNLFQPRAAALRFLVDVALDPQEDSIIQVQAMRKLRAIHAPEQEKERAFFTASQPGESLTEDEIRWLLSIREGLDGKSAGDP